MISVAQKVGALAIAGSSSVALTSYALSKPLLLDSEYSRRERLPIYPLPQPQIVLVEQHSALESHIAAGREGATSAFETVREATQGVVAKIVGVERRTINKVQSLLPEDESLNPGALWVTVATLSGSIFARNRNILLRLTLPPAILLTALPTFLPHLSANLSNEISSQTRTHAPALHDSAASLRHSVLESTASARATYASSLKALTAHIHSGLDLVESKTGLQLAKAFENAKLPSSSTPVTAEGDKVVLSSRPAAHVTVPLFNEHATAPQTVPGFPPALRATVATAAVDATPDEVLSVPIYTQVSSGPRSVEEKVDSKAAQGLDKLETEAAKAIALAKEKSGVVKVKAGEVEGEAERGVRTFLGELKNAKEQVEGGVDSAVKKTKEVAQEGEKKVDELKADAKVEKKKWESGYKKLV